MEARRKVAKGPVESAMLTDLSATSCRHYTRTDVTSFEAASQDETAVDAAQISERCGASKRGANALQLSAVCRREGVECTTLLEAIHVVSITLSRFDLLQYRRLPRVGKDPEAASTHITLGE